MSMVKMDDFRGEDKCIDWHAFHKAQIEAGEICQRCQTHITLSMFNKGIATLCYQCREATEKTEELWHDKFVRCPKCGHLWDPSECEDYDLLGDGEHDATCPECDHDFEISTSISFSFKSPERIQEAEDELETVQETEHDKD